MFSRTSHDTHQRLDISHRAGGLRVLRVVRSVLFWTQPDCGRQQARRGKRELTACWRNKSIAVSAGRLGVRPCCEVDFLYNTPGLWNLS